MEIQISFYTGILIGFRSFPPQIHAPYFEHQIYLPFICIAFLGKIVENHK